MAKKKARKKPSRYPTAGEKLATTVIRAVRGKKTSKKRTTSVKELEGVGTRGLSSTKQTEKIGGRRKKGK